MSGGDIFSAALFKFLEGPVGSCTSASSVLGAAFQLCRSNARVLQVFFVALLWPPEVSVSLRKYPIKELMWDAEAVHANHWFRPAKLGIYNHGVYADKARSVQDFEVSHVDLPPDVHE